MTFRLPRRGPVTGAEPSTRRMPAHLPHDVHAALITTAASAYKLFS